MRFKFYRANLSNNMIGYGFVLHMRTNADSNKRAVAEQHFWICIVVHYFIITNKFDVTVLIVSRKTKNWRLPACSWPSWPQLTNRTNRKQHPEYFPDLKFSTRGSRPHAGRHHNPRLLVWSVDCALRQKNYAGLYVVKKVQAPQDTSRGTRSRPHGLFRRGRSPSM